MFTGIIEELGTIRRVGPGSLELAAHTVLEGTKLGDSIAVNGVCLTVTALSPAAVISVDPLPDGKSCRVVVPDDQLSLAIGKEGQNARLAAKLTGFKIDIKPASAPLEPIEEPEEDLFAEEAPAYEAPAEEAEAPVEEPVENETAEAPEEI